MSGVVPEDRKGLGRCVFCAYATRGDVLSFQIPPAPLAEVIIVTPNGPRAVCKAHALSGQREERP